VIIPPSIPMILYAVMADTSVVQLFVAGIVPGIIGGLGLMGMGLLVRAALRPAAGRGVPMVARREDVQGGVLGILPAGNHPGRHFRRCRHRPQKARRWR